MCTAPFEREVEEEGGMVMEVCDIGTVCLS